MLFFKRKSPPPLTKRRLHGFIANNNLHNLKVFFYDETDSTSTRAKCYAESLAPGERECALFIARRQTVGRGRLGKSFVSGKESGLWLSLLVYPDGKAPEEITVYAATVILKALADTLGNGVKCEPKIKWVNDLYLGGKKLAGILTEGAFDTEGRLRYAVCGIGINLYTADLPPEIAEIATDIESECGVIIDRAELAANVAKRFLSEIGTAGTPEVAARYKENSFIVGKKIKVIGKQESYPATAVDIDECCALVVRRDSDGEIITLKSGEVSILPVKDE